MLRITELKLPLGHAPEALEEKVRARLGLGAHEPCEIRIARRANDARRKSTILMV